VKSQLAVPLAVTAAIASMVFIFVQQKRHESDLAEVRQQNMRTASSLEEKLHLFAQRSIEQPSAPLAPSIETKPAVAASPTPGDAGPPTALDRPEDPHHLTQAQFGSKTPQEQMAYLHDYYETAFIEDHADPEWAHEAKRMMDEKLPTLLPEGSTLHSFQCRASVCRLETHHRDPHSYMTFLTAAFGPMHPLWNAGVYSAPLTGNLEDGLMVSYIARQEQSLPQALE
jgi:hypothetical protein